MHLRPALRRALVLAGTYGLPLTVIGWLAFGPYDERQPRLLRPTGTIAETTATAPPIVELHVERGRMVAGRFDDGWLQAVAYFPRNELGWAALEAQLATLHAGGPVTLQLVSGRGARQGDLLAAASLGGRLGLALRYDATRTESVYHARLR